VEYKIDDILRKVENLEAHDLVINPNNIANYGVTKPQKNITIILENGNKIDLFVGNNFKEDNKNLYFVKNSLKNAVYKVEEDKLVDIFVDRGEIITQNGDKNDGPKK
jgi:hypothetical protein